MRRTDIARILIITGLALLHVGCAAHRTATCRNPAKVIDAGGSQGGWVLVRKDVSVDDTAARIAKAYQVRTQRLTYLHGFSTYPMPQGSKFLCDKAVVEVHIDPPQAVVAGR